MNKSKMSVLILAVIATLCLSFVIAFIVYYRQSEKQAYAKWYSIESLNIVLEPNEFRIVDTNEQYEKYVKKYKDEELDLKRYDYLLIALNVDECSEFLTGVRSVKVEDNKIKVEFGYENNCGVCASIMKYYFIPFDKGLLKGDMEFDPIYTQENISDCNTDVVKKPIIYIYPEEDMNVSIKVGHEEKLSITYPKYNNGWNVYAKTNGDLLDLNTNKTYYGLYWEGINNTANSIREEGFVVSSDDIESFLEEKLSILGLNERESNEFIIYWLPILKNNKYNYIYFETIDEINTNMPLVIEPKPETMIRVVMEFKGLNNLIQVKEQKLSSVNRRGYTVVEWGGTELK